MFHCSLPLYQSDFSMYQGPAGPAGSAGPAGPRGPAVSNNISTIIIDGTACRGRQNNIHPLLPPNREVLDFVETRERLERLEREA